MPTSLLWIKDYLSNLPCNRQVYAFEVALRWLAEQGVRLRCRSTARLEILRAVDGVCEQQKLDPRSLWEGFRSAAEHKPRKHKGQPQQVLWQQLQVEPLPVDPAPVGAPVVSAVEVQLADEWDHESLHAQMEDLHPAQQSWVVGRAIRWLRHHGWIVDRQEVIRLVAAVAYEYLAVQDLEGDPSDLWEGWVEEGSRYEGIVSEVPVCFEKGVEINALIPEKDDLKEQIAELRTEVKDLRLRISMLATKTPEFDKEDD